jgi:MYXO-CTERM domain-containing protein
MSSFVNVCGVSRAAATLAAAVCVVAAPAQAAPFSISNLTPGTVFFVQGQSFKASVAGNGGVGVAPGSGNVFLDAFTVAYEDPSAGFANLYIYAALPTTANAATGVGSLGTGTYMGGGIYDFANLMLDAATEYYAVLPASALVFDGDGNPYAGGIDIFDRDPVDGQLDLGFGNFDIGFSASFNTVSTPGSLALALVGLAMLAGLRRRN